MVSNVSLPSQRTSLIEFPCSFPIKVMGIAEHDFSEQMVAVVRQIKPAFDAGTLEKRPSKTGKYMGLTVYVNVNNQQELDAIYLALTQHPLVKVVL
jgi:putative lipoic acid-binding regulatory protein